MGVTTTTFFPDRLYECGVVAPDRGSSRIVPRLVTEGRLLGATVPFAALLILPAGLAGEVNALAGERETGES